MPHGRRGSPGPCAARWDQPGSPAQRGPAHLVAGEEAHGLQLVEHGVVLRVDLVAPVHVAHHQEGVQPRAQQVPLVRRRVRAQHVRGVQVVVVALLPAGVVSRDEQAVEVLPSGDHRGEVVIHGEERGPRAARVLRVEVLLHALLEQPERVLRLVVQVPAHLGQDLAGQVAVVVLGVGLAQQLHHAAWGSPGRGPLAQRLMLVAPADSAGLPGQVGTRQTNSPESPADHGSSFLHGFWKEDIHTAESPFIGESWSPTSTPPTHTSRES